jgi:uncharacterized protein
MKWTTHELLKLVNTDNEFKASLDFSDYIENTDIIKISPVEVEGDFEIYDQEEFVFYIDIKCTLTLQCAITLEEVLYEMDFSTEETFTSDKNDDFNTIDGITIDLLPIIWSNIILEKPMRVVSENAYEKVDYEFEEFDEEIEVDNAFADLKKLQQ